MEYALLPTVAVFNCSQWSEVLILVLMEYALLPAVDASGERVLFSLNPCSNGICSLTIRLPFITKRKMVS